MPASTIELSPHEIQGLCQLYLQQDQNRIDINNSEFNFQVLSYKLKPTSDAPAGFLGRHQYLTIEILHKDAEGHEQLEKLRFFTKSAPTAVASHNQYLEEFGVFKKEIIIYRDVLPVLQNIFKDVAPKCYYADKNVLVFENLMAQGFKMAAGRSGLLNYEHLNCTLKTLAAMHASSIAHEVRMGKSLNELYAEAVTENAYPSDVAPEHLRLQNFNNANEVLKEFISLMPKYKEQLNYILEEFPKQMARIFELVKVSKKYKNVFLHADLWANNIMFQYGKYGESPIQCQLVDFQLSRYAPPMLDVITVLTIPTSRQFRDKYLPQLLCDYYLFMSEFLKREGLRVEDFLPKQEFDESAEDFRIAGLIESCLFSHLVILPPEATQQLTGSADGFTDFFKHKRVETCLKAFHTDQLYRERLTDMLEDFVDRFVLKEGTPTRST